MIASGVTPFLHYWVVTRPFPGQKESGDQYVVAPYDDGILVAVIDGLGHGHDAAYAAKLAAATLMNHPQEPIVTLAWRCHEELRKTRGAVMSIASFNVETAAMSWLGIGNVKGILLRADVNAKRVTLLPRNGIIGDRLPQLHPVTLPVHADDLLVFATDGIDSKFTQDVPSAENPRQLVHHIFHQHAKTTDDALILGAQWINTAGA